MKPLKFYLKKAQKQGWAIGQFNFSTIEVFEAIMEAAKKSKSPVILGTSEGEANFFGMEQAIFLRDYYRKKFNIPVFLNLDHGSNLSYIKKAVESGYDAIHFDGSKLPIKKNIELLKKIRRIVNSKAILEGELGTIGGNSGLRKNLPKMGKLTEISAVKDFVKQSKIDSLAVSVGTIHGIYPNEPGIDFERLKKIRQKTNAFLVLHAGSGVAENDIKKAINSGIVKININSELRLIWRKGLEKAFKNNLEEFKPYSCLADVKKNIEKKVEEKIKIFNSKNKFTLPNF
ncbi:MAG: class II fructose-bisphosphate aldolase [bacterium]|nr:class II fructose-bisphosphate aldolase [bacterium]